MFLDFFRGFARRRCQHRTPGLEAVRFEISHPLVSAGHIILGRSTRAELHELLGVPRESDPLEADASETFWQCRDGRYAYINVRYDHDVVVSVYASEEPPPVCVPTELLQGSAPLTVSWHDSASPEEQTQLGQLFEPRIIAGAPRSGERDEEHERCECIHRDRFAEPPADAVFGAILRGEVTHREQIEQLLGEPSYARCARCRGHDVEYLFASDGAPVPMALVFIYADSGDVLSASAHVTPGRSGQRGPGVLAGGAQ